MGRVGGGVEAIFGAFFVARGTRFREQMSFPPAANGPVFSHPRAEAAASVAKLTKLSVSAKTTHKPDCILRGKLVRKKNEV